jgi:hypothetical protein
MTLKDKGRMSGVMRPLVDPAGPDYCAGVIFTVAEEVLRRRPYVRPSHRSSS